MTRPDVQAAAQEFDIWARNGRDDSMARGHRPATGSLIESWQLGPDSVVLDAGCGNGWATRWLLDRGAGQVVGVDAAPEMVARCQELTDPARPARFEVASADALPLADASVSHVLNIESLYYYPDPAAALREWARVARPGARLGIMADLYADNPLSAAWVAALPIGVHLLSEQDFKGLCEEAGWSQVRLRRFVSPVAPRSPEEFEADEWAPSYELYLAGKAAGSLLIEATR